MKILFLVLLVLTRCGFQLGVNFNEAMSMLGIIRKSFNRIYEGNSFPTSFDWRTERRECFVGTVKSQGDCGSCYRFGVVLNVSLSFFESFGTSGSLAHRFCINHQLYNLSLSPQEIVDCDTVSSGCTLGLTLTAFWYMRHYGVTTDECYPYRENFVRCPSFMHDPKQKEKFSCPVEYYKRFYASNVKWVFPSEKEIQKEVLKGPVAASFQLHDDFHSYRSGIYSRKNHSKFDTWHVIQIIGWGEENGVKYWICENSWGAHFGENHGYFRIIRGTNECSIESLVFSADPSFSPNPFTYYEAYLVFFAIFLIPLFINLCCVIPCSLLVCRCCVKVYKMMKEKRMYKIIKENELILEDSTTDVEDNELDEVRTLLQNV